MSATVADMAGLPQASPLSDSGDLERRFGGLARLHGPAAYQRLRALRVAVVGLGGVGSWAVEALARSGVASLTLIDLDHVAESNINRQVQALTTTLGQAKVDALAERVALIHPGCNVHRLDAFVEADAWPRADGSTLLPEPVDALIDACDQLKAKAALALWSMQHAVPLVCVGAAGGKHDVTRLEVADLAEVTHDPLLASLRSRLRRHARDACDARDAHDVLDSREGRTPQKAPGKTKAPQRMGVRCVFSRESVVMPSTVAVDGSLNCHGYGSSVMVTASFGMAAAAEAVRLALALAPQGSAVKL